MSLARPRTLSLTSWALAVIATMALLPFQASAAPAFQDRDAAARPALDHYNLEASALALQGHDPVAYFPEGGGQPKAGQPSLTTTFRKVTYRFANEGNRNRFRADPQRYEPTYGGWCAYAMATGDEVEIDPESFLIQTAGKGTPERLYVFYDSFFADTRKRWLKTPDDYRIKADASWTELTDENEPRGTPIQSVNADGLALDGHDPVSLGEGDATPGRHDLATRYDGALYHFANAANRDRFLANPGRHLPAFGGWGLVALADGRFEAGAARAPRTSA